MSIASKLVRQFASTLFDGRRNASSRRSLAGRQTKFVSSETLEVRQLLTGDLQWAFNLGGPASGDIVSVQESLAAPDGGVVVSGHFLGNVDFDPTAGTTILSSGTSADVFLAQYNSLGALQWVRQWSGLGQLDIPIAIGVDGSVVMGGFMNGTVDFNPGTGVHNLTGDQDAYILKLDKNGLFEWARVMGAAGSQDHITAIAMSADGSVYSTGTFTTAFDADPGNGIKTLTPHGGGTNMFLHQMNASGNFVRSVAVGSAVYVGAEGLVIQESGDVAVVGRFLGDFRPSISGSVAPTNSLGSGDGFLASFGEFNSNFEFQWLRAIGGTGADQILSVTLGDDGLQLAGTFVGTVDFDAGPNVASRTALGAGGYSDIFQMTVGLNGEFRRVLTFGSSDNETMKQMVSDSEGNLYLTGEFRRAVDFDPGAGTDIRSSVGASDLASEIYVLKITPGGQLGFVQTFGGVSSEFDTEVSNTIAVSSNGSIYLGGMFSHLMDVDPQSTVHTLNRLGTADGFLLKLSQDAHFAVPVSPAAGVTLRRNGQWLEFWENSQNGTALREKHRLSAIGSVHLTNSNANGLINLDFRTGGPFSIRNGINVSGANLASVFVTGNGNEAAEWLPSPPIGHNLKVHGNDIQMTAVAKVSVSNVQHLFVQPQGSADVMNITLTPEETMRITGTTGGSAMTPIELQHVRDLTIDTSAKDGLLAQSNDTVTFAAGSYDVPGLKNVFVRTGKGNDTLTVNGPNIGLPVDDGRFWFIGGSGVDRVTAIGDTNWDLNDARLVSAGGGRVELWEIERASITGGISRNTISASGFSGDATLDGQAGNDLLRGGSGNDILFGGTGNDRLFGGAGDDTMYGQDQNDQIWGEAGEDTIYGGAGLDQIWGGDDNDWISGDSGDDMISGGSGDDTLNGGDQNDRLFGDAGRDILNGGNGDDQLFGGADNDTLNGQAGIDLILLEGTNNAEDLALIRASATSASFRRRNRGLLSVLELDTVTMDATDEFFVAALDGDDLISIDLAFTQLGSVDGGNGTDSCTSPAAWIRISC